jgi:hypothetical protein
LKPRHFLSHKQFHNTKCNLVNQTRWIPVTVR